MPADAVLVDTGPLAALFDPNDRERSRCRDCLGVLARDALVTTEAVVTECMYLLDFSSRNQSEFQTWLGGGRLRVEPILEGDRPGIAGLMRKYADLPMDYADATLVVLAGRLGTTRVFTLDRKDFSIYRVGRRRFEILP